jgi:cholesterol transport system auxiliary component
VRRWVWAILILATGCVDALKSEYPERRYFTLAAQRPGEAAVPAKEGVLRVRRFTASKLSEGNELVTRIGETEFETDFYNQFFSPPAMQLTEQAHRWLGASGLFSAVVGTGSSVPETHILEANVVALYADERQSAAVLEIQFMLVRVSAEPTSVLFQKSYREIAAGAQGPESCVRGWNTALGRILASLESDLAKVRKG